MTDTTFDQWTETSIGWVPPVGWRPSPEHVRAAYEVLDHIDAHPDDWNQDVYWCETGGCLAGWRVVLSGEKPDSGPYGSWRLASGERIPMRAAQLFGFPDEQALDDYTDLCRDRAGIDKYAVEDAAEYIFDGTNTRGDLGELVALIFGPRPDAMP